MVTAESIAGVKRARPESSSSGPSSHHCDEKHIRPMFDQDILDCNICTEPLASPIFQVHSPALFESSRLSARVYPSSMVDSAIHPRFRKQFYMILWLMKVAVNIFVPWNPKKHQILTKDNKLACNPNVPTYTAYFKKWFISLLLWNWCW